VRFQVVLEVGMSCTAFAMLNVGEALLHGKTGFLWAIRISWVLASWFVLVVRSFGMALQGVGRSVSGVGCWSLQDGNGTDREGCG
jgi:hypothetical protein